VLSQSFTRQLKPFSGIALSETLARAEKAREEYDREEAKKADMSLEEWREKEARDEARLEMQRQDAEIDRTFLQHLPPAVQDMSYASFTPGTAELTEALRRCAEWIPPYQESLTSHEAAKTRSLGLILSGRPGCGKTHLLAATVRALIQKNVPALYLNLASFLVDLRRSFDGDTPDQNLQDALTAPVLALDDIGVQRDTPWALETTYVLLNGRALNRRPTLISTNLTEAQLRQRAGESSGGDDDMGLLTRRIYSRVCDIAGTGFIDIDAPDYRLRTRI
jgi:DNA replication protein DnaC